MPSSIVLSTKEYNVVGTRPIRHDGYDKVTGKALYGADMNLPGMLHGKVLRSPHAHANILSIDTSKAEAHPEVMAVVTSADFADVPDEARVIVAGPPHQPEAPQQQRPRGRQGSLQGTGNRRRRRPERPRRRGSPQSHRRRVRGTAVRRHRRRGDRRRRSPSSTTTTGTTSPATPK